MIKILMFDNKTIENDFFKFNKLKYVWYMIFDIFKVSYKITNLK